MHPFILAAALALLPAPTHVVAGRVIDPSGVPLPDVRVTVLEARRTTSTDSAGRYRIAELPSGTFTLSFASIGRRPETRRVTLDGADVSLDVTMQESLIELDAVQVTATPTATDALASPQPMASRSGEELAANQAPSLGETLQGMPGVHSWSTGVGIGKPVIRGLSSSRVLVLDDGQRLESQQWGDEHSPNVETVDADRIEVIRGPASVLYGSDAIGGVVNVIRPDLPDAIGRPGFLHGTLSGGYGTNNLQPDGAVSLSGASGHVGFRASFSGRSSDNVRTPSYTLWNSGNRATSGSGTLGIRGGWGSAAATFSHRDEHIQLTDEDPAATPNQRIASDIGRATLAVPLGLSRLEITAGAERSRRREFEEDTSTAVALGLLQNTWTADVHFHHAPVGRLSGILGFSGVRTTFEKFGAETLIPGSRANNAGIYAFEQTELDRWGISAGLRYDFRQLTVDADSDIGVTAQQRTYHAVSGNVGLLFRVAEPVALVLNVGRGFRAPSSFDLFANGVHEGTVAFERGNAALLNETSLNTDVALRARTAKAAVEIGAFLNAIQHYIYSVPTGSTDPASGFEIFDVTQGNARLIGAEVSLQYHPVRTMHVNVTADYVRGQNTSTDTPLPNMPPLRATWSIRFEPRGGGTLRNPWLSFGGETNGRQARQDPAEAAFYADAFGGAGYQSTSYSLFNAGAGVDVSGIGRTAHLSLGIRNVFDTPYAEYLSRIKTNALNPGMGRTLVGKAAIDF